jgi:hypothetical protein
MKNKDELERERKGEEEKEEKEKKKKKKDSTLFPNIKSISISIHGELKSSLLSFLEIISQNLTF